MSCCALLRASTREECLRVRWLQATRVSVEIQPRNEASSTGVTFKLTVQGESIQDGGPALATYVAYHPFISHDFAGQSAGDHAPLYVFAPHKEWSKAMTAIATVRIALHGRTGPLGTAASVPSALEAGRSSIKREKPLALVDGPDGVARSWIGIGQASLRILCFVDLADHGRMRQRVVYYATTFVIAVRELVFGATRKSCF